MNAGAVAPVAVALAALQPVAALGYIVLGVLIGAACQHAAAWTAARTAVLEKEHRHQLDLNQLHGLHRLQLKCLRRELGLEPGESWAQLVERKQAEKPARPVLVRQGKSA